MTGAGGLIGSWVQHHWDDDRSTLIPIHRNEVDLLEPGEPTRMMEVHEPDAVVHLAWCASGSPGYRDSPDNSRWVRSSIELTEACQRAGSTLWLTGSVAEGPGAGADAYARAKGDLFAEVADDITATRVGWLRPTYVFDEEAGRPAVVAESLRQARNGETVHLLSPSAAHDFIHASDVGRAIALAVRHHLLGLLPVGSGTLRTVADLVEGLGVRWDSATPGAEQRTQGAHSDEVADTRYLRAYQWSPTRTEQFFAS